MRNFLKGWGRVIALGAAILVVALGLRLIALTLLPVFVDEAIYVRWAQVMRVEPTLRFVPLSDGKQPLFMWLVIPFLKIFSDPLFAGRLTSVSSGMATLIGIFLLSYSLFKSKKVALISSLIYAISPFSLFFDRMALSDALLSMFGVWTLLGAIWVSRTLRLDLAMLTGFVLGGGLLTKSPALFFVLFSPITWVFSRWPKERSRRPIHLIKLALLFAVTLVIGYGMYNILRLGPNFNMITLRNGDYVYPLSHFLVSPLNPLKTFLIMTFEWIWALGPGPILLMGVLGMLFNIKKHFKEVLILLVWFLVPVAVQAEFAKNFTARYILFSIPFLFVLAASSFLVKKEAFKTVVMLLFILFVFLSARADYYLLKDPEKAPLPRSERSGYLEDWTSGYGLREVGEYLVKEEMKDSGKTIVVGTEGYFGTLPDGLQIYVNSYRNIIVKGVGLPIVEVDKSLLESKKFGNKTYLVVNSTRFWGDPDRLGLELLAAYPKAVRPDGGRETLLFYEVTEAALSSKGEE
jgi:4-amino-4-deoxy-L-arabinose transferase-like glycosyltransferase